MAGEMTDDEALRAAVADLPAGETAGEIGAAGPFVPQARRAARVRLQREVAAADDAGPWERAGRAVRADQALGEIREYEAREASADIDYGAALDRMAGERTDGLRMAAWGAAATDPRVAARNLELARMLGLPSARAVDGDPQAVEQVARARQVFDALRGTQALADTYLSHPDFARATSDEAVPLSRYEGRLLEAAAAFRSGTRQLRAGQAVMAADRSMQRIADLDRVERMLADGSPIVAAADAAYANLTPEERTKLRGRLEREAEGAAIVSGRHSGRAQEAAEYFHPAVRRALQSDSIADWWNAFIDAPTHFLTVLPIQSAAQNPVSALGGAAVIGATAAAGPVIGAVTAVGAAGATLFAGSRMEYAGAILEAFGERGIDVRDPAQLQRVLSDEALMQEVRTGAFKKASIISALDAVSMGVASRVMAPAGLMAGGGVGRRIAREGVNLTAQAAVDGALGGAGEALGSLAAGQEVSAGAVMAEVLGGAGPAASNIAIMSALRAREAQTQARIENETLGELMTTGASLQARSRDPEGFRTFVERATADGAESVYIDGRVLTEVLNQSAPETRALLDALPDVAEQLTDAALGADVAIPTADLMTTIAGTPLADAILPHLRPSVDGTSLAEATVSMQAALDRLKKDGERAARGEPTDDEAWQQSKAAVESRLVADLKTAGQSDDEAQFNARLAASVIEVLAANAGTTPDAVMGRLYPLQVVGPQGQTAMPAREATLAQPVTQGFQWEFGARPGLATMPDIPVARLTDPEPGAPPGRVREAVGAHLRSIWPERSRGRGETITDRPLPVNVDTGWQISLNQKGRKKLSRDMGSESGPRAAIYAIESLIRDAVLVESHPDRKGKARAVHRLYAPVEIDGVLYRAKLTVLDMAAGRTGGPEGTQVHALESVVLERGEPADAIQPEVSPEARPSRTPEGSAVSVANLLRGVKTEDGSGTLDQSAPVDPTRDDLLTAIAKLGGLKRDQATSQWGVDPADFGRRAGIMPVFRKDGGRDIDDLRTVLEDLGYLTPGDLTGFEERVGDSLRGEPQFTPEGWEARAQREAEEDARSAAADAVRARVEDAREREAIRGQDDPVSPAAEPNTLGATTEDRDPFGPVAPGPRGQISFGQGIALDGARIRLLGQADASTFIHELGHFYLEALTDLARRDDVPAVVRSDLAAVLSWAGWDTDRDWSTATLDERRDVHERFARGFEAYLMEGSAPVKAMQPVFSRFRAWLVEVYRSITALDVELTPEVRGVFDRMVATSVQLADAADEGYAPVFRAPQEMPDPSDWNGYIEAAKATTNAAIAELDARHMRDMAWLSSAKSRMFGQYRSRARALRARYRDEIEPLVRAEPVQQAYRVLHRGEPPEDRVATEALLMAGADLSSPNAIRSIDRQVLAAALGFDSEQAMAAALRDRPSIDAEVDRRIDARMMEEHAELASEDAIRTAVDRALANDSHLRFAATEAAMMGEVLQPRVEAGTDARGRRRTVDALLAVAKQWAAARIDGTRIRALDAHRYRLAAQRAGREAARHWAAGRRVEASEAKHLQVMNERAAREAADRKAWAERTMKRLRKLADSPPDSISADYREQIVALLERYEFRAMTGRELDRREGLRAWVERQATEEGVTLDIPDSLLDEARTTPAQEMTVAELRDLADAVDQIAHVGRLKQRLLTAKDKREFEAAKAELKASIGKYGGKARRIDLAPPRGIKAAIVRFLAQHRKLASLARQFDGGNPNGPWTKYFMRALTDAATREQRMQEEAGARLAAIFRPIMKLAGSMHDPRYIDALGLTLTREQRIAIALNYGNEGNRQRLLKNFHDGYEITGMTESQAQAVLSTLTDAELDAVQQVWDLVDSYWPEIVAKARRVNGTAPEKVEASAFTVRSANGTVREMRGGYYPVDYDSRLADRPKALSEAEAAAEMMRGAYTAATTRRGHEKARETMTPYPLSLSLDVLSNHINNVIHDLTHHEALIDANRILRDKTLSAEIRSRLGPDVLDTMKKMLETVAAGDRGPQTGFEAGLMRLRSNIASSVMGMSIQTAIQQPLGLSQSARIIGWDGVARGFALFVSGGSPIANARRVNERSAFMASRARTMNQDLQAIDSRLRRSAGKGHRIADAQDRMSQGMFWLMTKMQGLADYPTWMAAHEAARQNGHDEQTAVSIADTAVADAQSSGRTVDLAQVQTGVLGKLFGVFYSYFNQVFNLIAESKAQRTRQWSEGERQAAIIGMTSDTMALWIIPALLTPAMLMGVKGEEPPEDLEAWLKWAGKESLKYGLGTMIGVREASGLIDGFNYSGPAPLRLVSEIDRVQKQISQGELDQALLTALVGLTGAATGLPSAQINRSIRGYNAWMDGEAWPTSALFGPPPKKQP